MAWKEEHIHVHVHNDNKDIVGVLKEINETLKKCCKCDDDEDLKQEIMDKLNAAIADIKSTV